MLTHTCTVPSRFLRNTFSQSQLLQCSRLSPTSNFQNFASWESWACYLHQTLTQEKRDSSMRFASMRMIYLCRIRWNFVKTFCLVSPLSAIFNLHQNTRQSCVGMGFKSHKPIDFTCSFVKSKPSLGFYCHLTFHMEGPCTK